MSMRTWSRDLAFTSLPLVDGRAQLYPEAQPLVGALRQQQQANQQRAAQQARLTHATRTGTHDISARAQYRGASGAGVGIRSVLRLERAYRAIALAFIVQTRCCRKIAATLPQQPPSSRPAVGRTKRSQRARPSREVSRSRGALVCERAPLSLSAWIDAGYWGDEWDGRSSVLCVRVC